MYFLLFVLMLSACASPATPTADVVPVPSSTEAVAGTDEAGFYPQPTRTGIADVVPVPSSTEAVLVTDEAGFYPLSTRTGIADIDAVLAAVESGDPGQLRDLIRFRAIPCTRAEGLGGPPKCQDEEAEGTPVEVLPFLGPEGHFLRKANVSNFPGVNVIGLYAVYKVSDSAYSEEAYPAGEYAVIFVGRENEPGIVIQIRGGIVRIDYLFFLTSLNETVRRDASELILAPQ